MVDERYSRQYVFEKIGEKGQAKLSKGVVTIIGCGGLGSWVSSFLVRAGVGTVRLIDSDVVDITNIHRQALYDTGDIDKKKSLIAAERLKKINPEVDVKAFDTRITHENIGELLQGLVIDCTDNLSSRFLINEFCRKEKKIWIYAGVIMDIGTAFVVRPEGACFRCFAQEAENFPKSDTMGIMNTAVATIAAIEATEAIKLLIGDEPEKALMSVNIWNHTINKVEMGVNPNCPVCNGTYEFLDGKIING